jgi:hypothetical protein
MDKHAFSERRSNETPCTAPSGGLSGVRHAVLRNPQEVDQVRDSEPPRGRYPSQSPQPKLRVNILRTGILELEPTIKSLCMAESRFRTVADAVGDCIHSYRASRCPVPGAQYGILSAWILFLLSLAPKAYEKLVQADQQSSPGSNHVGKRRASCGEKFGVAWQITLDDKSCGRSNAAGLVLWSSISFSGANTRPSVISISRYFSFHSSLRDSAAADLTLRERQDGLLLDFRGNRHNIVISLVAVTAFVLQRYD